MHGNTLTDLQFPLSRELFLLNSGDTCVAFKFWGKIELSIDLFTRILIGFDIDGCANFKIVGDIESYPVALFLYLIYLFVYSHTLLSQV